MRNIILMLVLLSGIVAKHSIAQNKVVLLDISLEDKSEYLKVSPDIFTNYREIVENQLGAKLIINEDKEVTTELLKDTDVLVVLSTLSSAPGKKMRTEAERQAIVDFVRKGGRLVLFTDENRRMNLQAFGANEIANPFGISFGDDLPMIRNVGAISFPGEFIKGRYELPYSGSREIKGGIPLSVMNSEGGIMHGSYVKLEGGGSLVAFGETMVGLFIGGVTATMPDGSSFVWKGKDNYPFMKELITWLVTEK